MFNLQIQCSELKNYERNTFAYEHFYCILVFILQLKMKVKIKLIKGKKNKSYWYNNSYITTIQYYHTQDVHFHYYRAQSNNRETMFFSPRFTPVSYTHLLRRTWQRIESDSVIFNLLEYDRITLDPLPRSAEETTKFSSSYVWSKQIIYYKYYEYYLVEYRLLKVKCVTQ